MSTAGPAGPGEDGEGDREADAVHATAFAREPYRYDFFQAIRLLARFRPAGRALGGDSAPGEEICRFRSHATLAFPASQIQEFRPSGRKGRPPELVVNFFGLVGPLGALPRSYTDIVLERRFRRRDTVLHDFLDLFNHRLLSLFYKAWEKYRGWIGHEAASRAARRRAVAGEDARRAFILHERQEIDRVSQVLLEIAGLGEPALRYRVRERDRLVSRTALRDETLRFFAGLLSQRHRSAAGLEAILSAQFGRPMRVRQLCGRWLVLEPEDCANIGTRGRSELGGSLVVGSRVWDAQGKFRVEIGPLGFAEFSDCLPEGSVYRPLTELTRLYAGMEFDFDFDLRLRPEEVPQCRPGRKGAERPRLGWTTWLKTKPMSRPAKVILRPREAG